MKKLLSICTTLSIALSMQSLAYADETGDTPPPSDMMMVSDVIPSSSGNIESSNPPNESQEAGVEVTAPATQATDEAMNVGTMPVMLLESNSGSDKEPSEVTNAMDAQKTADIEKPLESAETNNQQEAIKGVENSDMDMMGGLITIVQLALYLFIAYSFYRIYSSLQVSNAWLAFIPVLSIIPLLRSANMSLWWILGLFVPFLNIYIIIRAFHEGISLRTGHTSAWTVGLILLGIIFIPLTAFTYKPQAISPTPLV